MVREKLNIGISRTLRVDSEGRENSRLNRRFYKEIILIICDSILYLCDFMDIYATRGEGT